MLKPVLIFGCFGPLIGTVALEAIYLAIEAASGRQVRYELDDFPATLWFGCMFGLLPALLTGALLTRWYTLTTLALLVLKAAAIGAVVSLVFFGVIFGLLLSGPAIDLLTLKQVVPFALAGGVAAVVCSMLSRRYWHRPGQRSEGH